MLKLMHDFKGKTREIIAILYFLFCVLLLPENNTDRYAHF